MRALARIGLAPAERGAGRRAPRARGVSGHPARRRALPFASSVVVASLGTLPTLSPATAEACSCAPGASPLKFVPASGAVLPTNGRIRAITEGHMPAWPDGVPVSEVDVLTLRRRGGGSVRADARAIGHHALEIVPSEHLDPNAVYELVVERSGKPRRVVADYRTGPGPDVVPPRWDGKLVGRRHVGVPPDRGACERFGADVSIETDEPVDEDGEGREGTSGGVVFFAVWFSSAGTIDYGRPPEVIFPAGKNVLFGPGHKCGGRGLVCYPCERLGIRALDVAGNASPPREVNLGPRLRRVR